ncbi:sulfatase [Coraliomargarita sp. SDUM461004]|uniref:Sulfatase n=1 Tax=Thalassobacterium sedimentorum TaxID=3041258 RepID=A0ABU1AGN9_9BACT|nr:sulfatase [Coraliomargarita sp. SDUM461004]MDQ8192936.1 sulfatase [Coraliomargarita sp. SDUM461004]
MKYLNIKYLLLGLFCLNLASYAKRPNVVLITIDDLNDWASCMGAYPDARTPNIDRLADSGLLFMNAYCTTAQCGPSRTAMLTGLDANTTGLYRNEDYWKVRFPGLQSMPMLFGKAGYAVYGTGKVFHGNTQKQIQEYCFEKDWDEYFVPNDSPTPRINNQPVHPMEDVKPWIDWGGIDTDDSEMFDYNVASYAISKLEANHGDQPFFLAVGFHKPHAEWFVPQKYFDARPLEEITLPLYKANDLEDLPTGAFKLTPNDPIFQRLNEKGWLNGAIQGYLASVDFMDVQVGRVLDAIEENGHTEDTIVIIWSDHGFHLGEKEHWMKHRLWERSTNTLLMMRVPGKTTAKSVHASPVSSLDIFPTLADLCDLPKRKYRWDGYSLSELLTNPDWKRPKPVLTTQATHNYAVRSERYRYILYEDGGEELYDHLTDPNEWNNLAHDSNYDTIKTELSLHIPDHKIKAPRYQKEFNKRAKELQNLTLLK